ncbi:FkbM family methyltransferase [Leptospira meyeri]|uniref:FkbM family methyltransferase n=2 Tax=Leptospira meyeri TaxID=29508 RepID=A0A4R8MPV6_LEPME|nr:methyltransferase FkbM domain protein [Leptospira meyeri serovar Hardjo str. Went 5]EMJ86710.1 methyltransferase FkbM domain protein [Leptospira meyeri serovar Semaranga str. Veldrot Semarang 173]TDY71193.1 FkbM family methyltransferase [Leptospira meyeri]TGL52970.1 FkbM family methyltransferase [Leptospira meyeri]
MFLIKRIVNKLQSKNYFRSYSQEGEDMVLRDLFGDKRDGHFVDIGAYDPFRFSNTNYFYELGWTGINIEPSPDGFRQFEIHRKQDINLNIGIGLVESELVYYRFEEAALNTFDAERVKFLEETTNYKSKDSVKVKVRPLASVLQEFSLDKKIDFMNIDVEWNEISVLKSGDWKKFRPKVILIEILNFELETIAKNPIHLLLNEIGYSFYCKTPRTCFYLDKNFSI